MTELSGRLQWLLRLPMKLMSLRTIVIVSAVSVVAVVVSIGAWVWIGITNDQFSQLDRRLDSVSSLGDFSNILSTTPSTTADQPSPEGSLVRTARIGGATVSTPRNIVLPKFENGYANTTIDGVEYRVRTFSAGPASIAFGAPIAETQKRIDDLHRRVLIICGTVIAGTVLVGWVISLVMVNPFRLLAQQARAINAQSKPDEVQVRGVWEAVEIAEAVEGMLARIGNEQERTRAALESARDFAAVASHARR
jgi:two-component system sensor histidine kinase PrrB